MTAWLSRAYVLVLRFGLEGQVDFFCPATVSDVLDEHVVVDLRADAFDFQAVAFEVAEFEGSDFLDVFDYRGVEVEVHLGFLGYGLRLEAPVGSVLASAGGLRPFPEARMVVLVGEVEEVEVRFGLEAHVKVGDVFDGPLVERVFVVVGDGLVLPVRLLLVAVESEEAVDDCLLLPASFLGRPADHGGLFVDRLLEEVHSVVFPVVPHSRDRLHAGLRDLAGLVLGLCDVDLRDVVQVDRGGAVDQLRRGDRRGAKRTAVAHGRIGQRAPR